ncbi:SURF1 family protein [Luteimonas aquatica]|uniref:SURF1 family protein n=1 Tax=Luteimonas aquatica TaxID=450364 RepID=UPI001F56C3FD|nr:SURF1 family protein [Luteimonas aquatica]
MSRRRHLPLLWTLALLVAAGFCALGVWQYGRMQQKQALLEAVHALLQRREAQPLALAGDPRRAAAFDWAAGEGEFVPGPAVLLDNQQREDRAGVRVFRPFRPADGAEPLLVELGWLPLPGDRRLPSIPLPAGRQRVRGLLAPPPSHGILAATATAQPDGTLLATGLDMPALARALKLPRLPARVLKLDPALPLGYARDLDILPNTLPPERHLGYAVQWFALALAVLATALVLTLRKPKTSPRPPR